MGPKSREDAEVLGALREVPVESIQPNPWQPRREFHEEALQELTDSIKASGLLQPPVVRPVGNGYELIAGERRLRAVKRLGWETIPVVLREVDDQAALTLAMIENLQRDDLSAIDTALGYQQLIGEFGVSQAEVARIVGRDRSTVANTLRLLKLPTELQELLRSEQLSEGQARAILGLETPAQMTTLAKRAVSEGLSVRQVESAVRGADAPARKSMMKRPPTPSQATGDARRVEDVLRQRLGTDIRLTAKRRGRGTLTISYYSNDDLARVLELILGSPFEG
ncbi:MAG: ParB/RepB/Spo0J family partition protein [Gemmatimonadota bacterium]